MSISHIAAEGPGLRVRRIGEPPREMALKAVDGVDDVAVLLERVGRELDRLHETVLAMQAALGPALAAAAGDHAVMRGWQDIDLVAQSLAGLAEFHAALLSGRLHHRSLDLPAAAKVVKLERLSANLAGDGVPGSSTASLEDTVELF